MRYYNLRKALRVSVPVKMKQLKSGCSASPEEMDKALSFLKEFSGKVNEFQRVDRVVGGTPALFNELTYALALLSFLDGGVKFLGDVWDIKRTVLP